MDWRVLIVLVPLFLAAGWALYNVGAVAIQQARQFLNQQNS